MPAFAFSLEKRKGKWCSHLRTLVREAEEALAVRLAPASLPESVGFHFFSPEAACLISEAAGKSLTDDILLSEGMLLHLGRED